MRRFWRLPLTLFVAWVLANHTKHPVTLNDATIAAKFFDRRPNFHQYK